MTFLDAALRVIGIVLVAGISVIAIRMLYYWRSFLFSWQRYRQREHISTTTLMQFDVPNVKIQITTRGSAGSSEVIMRGIRNVLQLAAEQPAFYRRFLSIEIVTESAEQAELLDDRFAGSPIAITSLVMPADYETPNGTRLKARGLHYAVERRRDGWNHRPGRTFIVHYDEESVMVPNELRKLIAHLATTDKMVLEGPIYYPLEYREASALCRAMEANRPVGCFECRQVMENGVPLHLHGSNLVVDEEFENEIGWDIGMLDGQPLIAEDYVFGMNAFVQHGAGVFGWHGCVMLEQPPFSVRSAFKQRHRWIFGVLQGMALNRRHPSFRSLPAQVRFEVVWGTRFRIATFALGSVVGALALLYMPMALWRQVEAIGGHGATGYNWALTAWLAVVGTLWLGSVFIGARLNVHDAGLSTADRSLEVARALAIAPVAGLIESSAGLWAVIEWCLGRREVFWQPTPKTRQADATAWTPSAADAARLPHLELSRHDLNR